MTDRELLVQWADRLVAHMKEEDELIKLCNDDRVISEIIRGGSREGIHVHTGIDKLADALGVELTVETRDCKRYPYRYSLEYKGFVFTK